MSEQISFQIAGLTVSVLAYEFPENEDLWDGNWLLVQAELVAPGCKITHRGTFLRTDELGKFEEALNSLHALKSNNATLECTEPYLRVEVVRDGNLGSLKTTISLTPQIAAQSHKVEFESDLSYLAGTLGDLKRVLQQFPIRGAQ